MPDYKPVPVHIAHQISKEFEKSMVVILCYDPVYELTHVTTYGASAWDKEQAAAVGEMCSQAVGGDLSRKQMFEDFHRDYDPARAKEAMESLMSIRKKLEEIVCVEGVDAGVVMLDVNGSTHPEVCDGETVQVYDNEYFSPLGDALMELWKMAGGEAPGKIP